jgi:YNFM family putative membrane transporter
MTSSPVWIKFGTPEYRRTGMAFFLAGFATFSLLYCAQPLMPVFAAEFSISPAESSLAQSLTTGALAFSVAAAGAFSQAIGRRGLMFASMAVAAILNFLAAVSPDWHGLLAARALEGVVLGGLPPIAMAYLAEETDPEHLGKAMGLYVAGSAFGGMMGRIGMGILSEFMSWRPSLAVLAAYCLIAAIGFRILLPPSRNFVRRPGLNVVAHLQLFRRHLGTAGLMRIYASAFVGISIFVVLFNYMTFRLTEAPYLLNQAAISLIFLIYGFGVVSSSMGGALADRFGGRPLLIASFTLMLAGILLTLAGSLVVIVAGLIVMTTSYFVAHAVNSASVGPLAGGAKAHASALYLVFYYLGSSVSGTAGGWLWEHGGWPSVVMLASGCAVTGLLLAFSIRPKPSGPAAPV